MSSHSNQQHLYKSQTENAITIAVMGILLWALNRNAASQLFASIAALVSNSNTNTMFANLIDALCL